MKLIKVFTSICMVLILIFSFNINAYSHSGRTDSNGGHWNRKTGTYHYHNGGTSTDYNVKPTTKPTVKPIEIFIDNKKINFDIPPIIINGRTMVPVRTIFESLNMRVNWDNYNKSIIAIKDNITIQLFIGGEVAFINEKPSIFDTPPIILNSRAFVPVRFISEALNKKVTWDGNARVINIEEIISTPFLASTPIPTIKPTPTITIKPTPTIKLETEYDIENYLQQNYSTLNTSLGKTSFKFYVFENNSIVFPEDYSIIVECDSSFFYNLQYSNKINDNVRPKVAKELKKHMQKISNSLILLLPDKKMDGYYSYCSSRYYNWKNYSGDFCTDYKYSKIINFEWYQELDDELLYKQNSYDEEEQTIEKQIIKKPTVEKQTVGKQVYENKEIIFDDIEINYTTSILSNNSVGNEWSSWIEVNNETYYKNNINIPFAKELQISITICESDDAKSDFGWNNITINTNKLKKGINTFTGEIIVTENGGRYSGNRAIHKYYLNILIP